MTLRKIVLASALLVSAAATALVGTTTATLAQSQSVYGPNGRVSDRTYDDHGASHRGYSDGGTPYRGVYDYGAPYSGFGGGPYGGPPVKPTPDHW